MYENSKLKSSKHLSSSHVDFIALILCLRLFGHYVDVTSKLLQNDCTANKTMEVHLSQRSMYFIEILHCNEAAAERVKEGIGPFTVSSY